MQAAKSLPPAFDTLIKTDMTLPGPIKTDQELLGVKRSNATEPGDDIVAFGANSIGEIEKLMEELRIARDYLRTEGERVRRINARYARLTRSASASAKIIVESMGKWRTTELDAVPDETPGPSVPCDQDSKLQNEMKDAQVHD